MNKQLLSIPISTAQDLIDKSRAQASASIFPGHTSAGAEVITYDSTSDVYVMRPALVTKTLHPIGDQGDFTNIVLITGDEFLIIQLSEIHVVPADPRITDYLHDRITDRSWLKCNET